MPKEESFPIPLKYVVVIRTTHTNLDVLEERRIDDCWNVDADRSLSDSWAGFTKFSLRSENLPKGCMWSWERLTKIQATTRPDYVWPETWSGMPKAAQKKKASMVHLKKTKLDDARKLRGSYFIDPENGEYDDTIKKRREKLEISMEAAMLCKM